MVKFPCENTHDAMKMKERGYPPLLWGNYVFFPLPTVRNSEVSFVDDIRYQMERHAIHQYSNFFRYPLPKMISDWTREYATVRELDPNMVLLSSMGGISGADRGLTQIQTGEGRLNNLSLLIFVSAESGSGKSSAMQPVLDAYTAFEEEEYATLERQIATQDALKAVLQQQRKDAIKYAADTGHLEPLEKLSFQLNGLNMKKRTQLPRLFVNDVTSASLSEAVSRWGYANVMDPDGTSLDLNTYRQIAKYWSGEGNAQLRVTRDSSVVRQPFISCVVFTQPRFFQKLVLAEDQRAMGITARSLLYVCPPSRPRGNRKRGVNEGLMRSFPNKLRMLLQNSAYTSDGARPPKESFTLNLKEWRHSEHSIRGWETKSNTVKGYETGAFVQRSKRIGWQAFSIPVSMTLPGRRVFRLKRWKWLLTSCGQCMIA